MSLLLPGFSSSIEAQACFRGVLRALSAPGLVVTLDVAFEPPEGLCPAAAAILLTLADPFVSVSLPEGSDAAWEWLNFHARARAAEAVEADFVVATERPPLGLLQAGTDDEPEGGATLILQCAMFAPAPRFRLTGPGIEAERVAALPLDERFAAEWRAQSRNAPRGVDVFLCAGMQVIGLPRSLKIEEI